MRRTGLRTALLVVAALAASLAPPAPASAERPTAEPVVTLLASGLRGASGSAIGPDGALYVTEGAAGRVSRIDLETGQMSTLTQGLPLRVLPLGGAIDVAFNEGTAYVLVTVVGPSVGGVSDDHVGIYRVDGPTSQTLIADIGAFAAAHKPDNAFVIRTGVQYALEPYRGGFVVSDGHHDRLYQVGLDGSVTEMLSLVDSVPTGLARQGGTVLFAAAGTVPHRNGKVYAYKQATGKLTELATGGQLLVDVESGRGRTLYALAQGLHAGGAPGSPARPNTGALLHVTDGALIPVAQPIDRPTSLEIVRTSAYVVTLGGDVLRISQIGAPPYGAR
jgi:hypothetical protein